MHERNSQASDSGLFADKGQAEPTRDFVPRLKTDEPAQIDSAVELLEAVTEAKPLPHADGLLGGLIRRRAESQQPLTQSEQDKREAAHHAARETEEITRSVSEHIDNGMLYESLRLGLPLPKLSKAMAKSTSATDETKSFEEAALERLARPTTRESSGTVPTARADKTASERKRGRKSHSHQHRRQLTARLSIDDFQRFKHYAEDSGRTYQDILSTAATHYLDEVSADPAPAETSATPTESADDQGTAETGAPKDVKSLYDWIGTG